MATYFLPIIALIAVILIGTSARVLREYERAVVFTLGRFQRSAMPIDLIKPFLDLRDQAGKPAGGNGTSPRPDDKGCDANFIFGYQNNLTERTSPPQVDL